MTLSVIEHLKSGVRIVATGAVGQNSRWICLLEQIITQSFSFFSPHAAFCTKHFFQNPLEKQKRLNK